jgi:hypothetical protein
MDSKVLEEFWVRVYWDNGTVDCSFISPFWLFRRSIRCYNKERAINCNLRPLGMLWKPFYIVSTDLYLYNPSEA